MMILKKIFNSVLIHFALYNKGYCRSLKINLGMLKTFVRNCLFIEDLVINVRTLVNTKCADSIL